MHVLVVSFCECSVIITCSTLPSSKIKIETAQLFAPTSTSSQLTNSASFVYNDFIGKLTEVRGDFDDVKHVDR